MGEVVRSWERLSQLVEARRGAGATIVTTNGVFDILHVGHARYLRQAREMGDLLVVGLNSDSSTRRLKGPDRPLVQEDDRAELVAALACVDYVTLFDGPTPEAFLETIRPAVHVKGGDYRPEQLPEARVVTAHGGRVVIVPFVEGRSSSIIIERIARAQSRTDG